MLLKTWNIITEKFFGLFINDILLVRKHGNGILPFKPDENIFSTVRGVKTGCA